MLKPILQGAKIGIVSPSSSVESPEEIRNGLAYLAELGYETKLGRFVFNENKHFSGSPQQRASDIMSFFQNSDIKAILATGGGYGSQSLLPHLDYDIIRVNPKPIIGFSDVTALQNAILTCSNVSSVAGIMLKFDFYDGSNDRTKRSFETILRGVPHKITEGSILNKGIGEGVLVGGNLCTFMSLAGTKYFPSLARKILLIEDIDEKSYRVERMLSQLEQQNEFKLVSGIVFGNFRNCEINHYDDKNIDEILYDFAGRYSDIPMIKNFPHGHIKSRYCLPLGERVKLIADGLLPTLQIAE